MNWYLLRFFISKSPEWGKDIFKSKFYIFREIAYVNDKKKLIGLGRSFLPFNILGLSIFLKCMWCSKPLGVVLKKKYGYININVISHEILKKKIGVEFTEVNSYKRILSYNSPIALVEEDFII